MRTYSAGIVTAYGSAKAGGYTGSYAEFCEALGNLADVLEDLEGLTVVANTLPEGSSATASYTDGVLTLGIPKGDTGETGNGIESVELTSTSGAVKTYTITFTDGTTTTFDVTDGEVTNASLAQALAPINDRISAIEDAEGLHKYGVSGLGNGSPTLTRIWDSVGMTAQVGTDGDNSSVINNFDDVTPFNRRKCVGKWELIDGRAVFRVEAYKGDEDYAEDGTMGDYVAVECPRAYYYLKDGVLGVSAHKWDSDWRPFDIFCHDHNPEDTMEFVYLPAYALALKDGKAVSLPGLPNEQGTYYDLVTRARTYDGDVKSKAMLQPAAVNFYEWALFTVEFATQNCQSIMQGCAGLRQSNDDHVTFVDSTHALTNNYYASRVVGEYVAIIATNIDVNSASYKPTHKITAILRCDENGNESSSGTHQLLTLEDLGAGYYTYDTTTEYRLASRPYYTGSCNGVSTPSGSPVSNSDSYHPMQYRWRENVFSNQYKTLMDLFAQRVGTGDSDYYLKWFYILDPTTYTPSASGKPDAADLATFHELGVQTEHEIYASGYVKSKKYDAEFPDIWIPDATTGGSASTYFCDYAYLVLSSAVRSARFGGTWYYGSSDGFSYLYANNAPAHASAAYGGDLCFAQ